MKQTVAIYIYIHIYICMYVCMGIQFGTCMYVHTCVSVNAKKKCIIFKFIVDTHTHVSMCPHQYSSYNVYIMYICTMIFCECTYMHTHTKLYYTTDRQTCAHAHMCEEVCQDT